MKLRLAVLGTLVCLAASAQTTGTFGVRVPAPGTLSDIVLDEPRQRLYLVNNASSCR